MFPPKGAGMNLPKLPRLRGSGMHAEVRCSLCGQDSFQSSLGVGRLYVWEGLEGWQVSLDRTDQVAHITTPVKCVHCETEHAPEVEMQPGVSA
jgi:hypothetical protein